MSIKDMNKIQQAIKFQLGFNALYLPLPKYSLSPCSGLNLFCPLRNGD